MGNIHEPQEEVGVTKVPTEGQTQTLRRHSDPITPLCIRNVDDDGRNEEEAPDNATLDDEDHTDREKQVQVAELHARRNRRRCRKRQKSEHNKQDLNEHEESSHDGDSNSCFDEIPEDSPEDELEPQVRTKRTTGKQQAEPRRGSSGRAGYCGHKRG